MSAPAPRVRHRHRDASWAQRQKRRKTLRRRLSMLQETPVPQTVSLSSRLTNGVAQTRARLVRRSRKRGARTLSREFWQSKNFHVWRSRSASALVKTGFSRESRDADSRRVAHRLAAKTSSRHGRGLQLPPRARRLQMPSFDFNRSLTACGLALPPDDFIT